MKPFHYSDKEDKERMQRVFNSIATHLIKQNKHARNPNTNHFECLYRTPNGLACAIGSQISDQVYWPGIEGLPPFHPLVREALHQSQPWLFRRERDDRFDAFLDNLRAVHDSSLPKSWPTRLKSLAQTYSLDTTVLETLTSNTSDNAITDNP